MANKIITAVAVYDGHTTSINNINLELKKHGVEVVYLGYNRKAGDIVKAAVEEDVGVIGFACYTGAHIEFSKDILNCLREEKADISVVLGGGGTITSKESEELIIMGVDNVFPPGSTLWDMANYIKNLDANNIDMTDKRRLAKYLTMAERKASLEAELEKEINKIRGHEIPDNIVKLLKEKEGIVKVLDDLADKENSYVLGFTGEGGVGKSTLINELLLRYINNETGSVALIAVDPTTEKSGGALLMDRQRITNSYNERVFMRSMASRDYAGGIAGATKDAVKIFKWAGYELIMVESVGIGQGDRAILDVCNTSVYICDRDILPKARDFTQREKIAMLNKADVIVFNKYDQLNIQDKIADLRHVLNENQTLFTTIAKQHRDEGVDKLYEFLQSKWGS